MLEDGRIVQAGTPAQVARQPATDYVAKLVGLTRMRGRAEGSRVALADGGMFETAGPAVRGEALVAVRPSAIAVGHQRPQQQSPRNVWPARITGLMMLADRIRLQRR